MSEQFESRESIIVITMRLYIESNNCTLEQARDVMLAENERKSDPAMAREILKAYDYLKKETK